jgi:hypothetical protein
MRRFHDEEPPPAFDPHETVQTEQQADIGAPITVERESLP